MLQLSLSPTRSYGILVAMVVCFLIILMRLLNPFNWFNIFNGSNQNIHHGVRFHILGKGEIDIKDTIRKDKFTYDYTPTKGKEYKYSEELLSAFGNNKKWDVYKVIQHTNGTVTISDKNAVSYVKDYIDGIEFFDKASLQVMIGNENYGIPGLVFNGTVAMYCSNDIREPLICFGKSQKFADLPQAKKYNQSYYFMKQCGKYTGGGGKYVFPIKFDNYAIMDTMQAAILDKASGNTHGHNNTWVFQKAIEPELSQDGRKFDIRMHYLVILEHGRVHYYSLNAAYIRHALEKYEENGQEKTMITNIGVYKRAVDKGETSLTSDKVFERISQGNSLYDRTNTTITAFIKTYGDTNIIPDNDNVSYVMIGVDVMPDKNGVMKIIEVNHAPSFSGAKQEDKIIPDDDIFPALTDIITDAISGDVKNSKCGNSYGLYNRVITFTPEERKKRPTYMLYPVKKDNDYRFTPLLEFALKNVGLWVTSKDKTMQDIYTYANKNKHTEMKAYEDNIMTITDKCAISFEEASGYDVPTKVIKNIDHINQNMNNDITSEDSGVWFVKACHGSLEGGGGTQVTIVEGNLEKAIEELKSIAVLHKQGKDSNSKKYVIQPAIDGVPYKNPGSLGDGNKCDIRIFVLCLNKKYYLLRYGHLRLAYKHGDNSRDSLLTNISEIQKKEGNDVARQYIIQFDFETNYGAGYLNDGDLAEMKYIMAHLFMQRVSLANTKDRPYMFSLGIDLIKSKDGIKLIEVNAAPGFAGDGIFTHIELPSLMYCEVFAALNQSGSLNRSASLAFNKEINSCLLHPIYECLRGIKHEDEEFLINLTQDEETMKQIGNGKVWGKDKVKGFIEYNIDHTDDYAKVIVDHRGSSVGLLRIRKDDHAEKAGDSYIITVIVAPSFRGKGHGKYAVTSGLKEFTNTHKVSIHAAIFKDNKASVNMFKALGWCQEKNKTKRTDIVTFCHK